MLKKESIEHSVITFVYNNLGTLKAIRTLWQLKVSRLCQAYDYEKEAGWLALYGPPSPHNNRVR